MNESTGDWLQATFFTAGNFGRTTGNVDHRLSDAATCGDVSSAGPDTAPKTNIATAVAPAANRRLDMQPK
jgi:hypothetical protein